jgi:hypothetical protein
MDFATGHRLGGRMKISDIEQKLATLRQKHGDREVLITTDNGTFPFGTISHHVAEDEEYPEDWEMPGGFEFIDIRVFN